MTIMWYKCHELTSLSLHANNRDPDQNVHLWPGFLLNFVAFLKMLISLHTSRMLHVCILFTVKIAAKISIHIGQFSQIWKENYLDIVFLPLALDPCRRLLHSWRCLKLLKKVCSVQKYIADLIHFKHWLQVLQCLYVFTMDIKRMTCTMHNGTLASNLQKVTMIA